MLTPAECQALANEYKSLARQPDISRERAAMLTNIARSFTGLATQLDRLATHMRDHAK
jgi:plasmid stabilization system protein ParE